LKVAVSSTGPDLDATVSPRFGRCPYFVIVETATMGYEAITNNSANNASGAGIAAAQEVASRGIDAVLTGRFGPNAFQSRPGLRSRYEWRPWSRRRTRHGPRNGKRHGTPSSLHSTTARIRGAAGSDEP